MLIFDPQVHTYGGVCFASDHCSYFCILLMVMFESSFVLLSGQHVSKVFVRVSRQVYCKQLVVQRLNSPFWYETSIPSASYVHRWPQPLRERTKKILPGFRLKRRLREVASYSSKQVKMSSEKSSALQIGRGKGGGGGGELSYMTITPDIQNPEINRETSRTISWSQLSRVEWSRLRKNSN